MHSEISITLYLLCDAAKVEVVVVNPAELSDSLRRVFAKRYISHHIPLKYIYGFNLLFIDALSQRLSTFDHFQETSIMRCSKSQNLREERVTRLHAICPFCFLHSHRLSTFFGLY